MMAAASCKVFFGSLPHTLTEDELRRKVSEIGFVVNLFYMADQLQQQKGWAFVTFGTPDEAQLCIDRLNQRWLFPGFDRACECRFANQKPASGMGSTMLNEIPPVSTPWQQYFTTDGHPYYYNSITGVTQWERPLEMDRPNMMIKPPMRIEGAGGSSFGPPGANLFVFHLPNDWNDIDLVQHFQHFGEVVSARIQRDAEGRNRGFGFVSFGDQRAAVQAIRGMHGFNVGGKFLKVQLKKGEETHLTPALKSLLPPGYQSTL